MAVGRGYQPADFTPVSQFVPLPLDFLQKQLESTQKRQDTAMAEVDAVGSLISAIDPRLQDVGYAKQIQEEYKKELEPFSSGTDLTSSATISKIRQLKNKFAQDERLKTLSHNKEQQKLYDKLHAEGKLVGAILPEGDDFSYDANNINGKSVDLGKLLYFQDWQTPITNQLKLVEDEITKNNPGANIKTIRDDQGNWVRVLERPGQTTVKLKDDETFKAAIESITTEALQGSTPYSIYMNELAATKGKDPKAEVRNMIERLSIPMHKREETTDSGSMQVLTNSDELAKEERDAARAAAKAGKTDKEVINPNYTAVTSAYDVHALNRNFVTPEGGVKSWEQVKEDADKVDQAFYKVSIGDTLPMKELLFRGIDEGAQRYVSMDDIEYKLDADDNYIPNVNLTKESLAKNKLINDNKDLKGSQGYKGDNYVPSTEEIIKAAGALKDIDLFSIDNAIDANINSINNYRKTNNAVMTNAKNIVHKNLPENARLAIDPSRDKNLYNVTKQYAFADIISNLPNIADNDGNTATINELITKDKALSREYKMMTDYALSKGVSPHTGNRYIQATLLERTEQFLINLEKASKGKLNLRQPYIDDELGFDRDSYNEKLQEQASEEFKKLETQAQKVPVISWTREGQTREENQNSVIIDYENAIREAVGFTAEIVDKVKTFTPKNLQKLMGLEDLVVIENSTDNTYPIGTDLKTKDIFNPIEGGAWNSKKDTDEYFVGIQYQGVSNLGNQWRTVGNLIKADGSTGPLVSFKQQGQNTNKDVYTALGIGDISAVINTVDYMVDNSKQSNKATTESIIPGVKMDITRSPVLNDSSKQIYKINYTFKPEKIESLKNQLRQRNAPEEQIEALVQEITNPKKEFENKLEMGLSMQKLIEIFNDPSLGK